MAVKKKNIVYYSLTVTFLGIDMMQIPCRCVCLQMWLFILISECALNRSMKSRRQ